MTVEALALKLWQEREMRFPERTRRMQPDDMDRASGAWAVLMAEAAERLASDNPTVR